MATLRLVSFPVLLLLGLLPFGICEPDNREASAAPITPTPPLSAGPPGFDYFLLALTWPNAYCKQQGITCAPSVPPQRFTIHGLWPQKNNGQHPVDCTTTAQNQMTDTILENHRQDLLTYWPALRNANDFAGSRGFWRYQWNKHGSCSSNRFAPAAYLTAAINLAKKYSDCLLLVAQNAGIKPDGTTYYSNSKVLNAIQLVTGKEASLEIKLDRWGKSQLLEIRLCVNADGIIIQDCNYDNRFIFASAPSAFLNLSSSILKVEEAAGLQGIGYNRRIKYNNE